MDELRKENIQRVDNRSGSLYSVIIFMLVFTMIFIFYPQLSMLVPFAGERISISENSPLTGLESEMNASCVVIARVTEKGKAVGESTIQSAEVYRPVALETVSVLKGQADKTFTLKEMGGSALFREGNRDKKYTFVYENEAEFTVGETYLIFFTGNRVYHGKSGLMQVNESGQYEDALGRTFTLAELKQWLSEVKA